MIPRRRFVGGVYTVHRSELLENVSVLQEVVKKSQEGAFELWAVVGYEFSKIAETRENFTIASA